MDRQSGRSGDRRSQELGPDFCAAILSGGLARRAGGVNKSFLAVESRPILDWQLEALRPVFAGRILVVTDRAADYAPFDLRCVPDLPLPAPGLESRSPLRGIASALAAAESDWVLMLASDMPWPDPAIIRRMASMIREREVMGRPILEGLCIVGPKGPEPFHAFYRRSLAERAAAPLRAGAQGAELSMWRWIDANSAILRATPEKLGVSAEAARRCLANFNS